MSPLLRVSRYPIGRLLLGPLADSGLRTGQFVQAIGYRNVTNGAASLAQWVRDGVGEIVLLKRLQASTYRVAPMVLQTALDATRDMKRAEQDRHDAEAEALSQARFYPYVRAVPEWSVPSFITGFALAGGWRRDTVRMPVGIALRSEARQDVLVGRAVRRHFAAVDGQTRFMGRITQYIFVPAYRAEGALFTVDGVRSPSPPPTTLPSGDAVLYLGRR